MFKDKVFAVSSAYSFQNGGSRCVSVPPSILCLFSVYVDLLEALERKKRKDFDSMFMLICWKLWKGRNVGKKERKDFDSLFMLIC